MGKVSDISFVAPENMVLRPDITGKHGTSFAGSASSFVCLAVTTESDESPGYGGSAPMSLPMSSILPSAVQPNINVPVSS